MPYARYVRSDRIEELIVRSEDGCWLWRNGTSTQGYGRRRVPGRRLLAHRWVYELLVGPVPAGATLDHLCRERSCVNPEHLEPVTMKVNIQRGESPSARAARTGICQRGHSLEDAYVDCNGRRSCRACRRLRDRAAWKRGERPGWGAV